MGFHRYPAQPPGRSPPPGPPSFTVVLPLSLGFLSPPFLKAQVWGRQNGCLPACHGQASVQAPKPQFAQALLGRAVPASWGECEVPGRECRPHAPAPWQPLLSFTPASLLILHRHPSPKAVFWVKFGLNKLHFPGVPSAIPALSANSKAVPDGRW